MHDAIDKINNFLDDLLEDLRDDLLKDSQDKFPGELIAHFLRHCPVISLLSKNVVAY